MRSKLSSFNGFSFSNVFQGANFMVDSLAKQGVEWTVSLVTSIL